MRPSRSRALAPSSAFSKHTHALSSKLPACAQLARGGGRQPLLRHAQVGRDGRKLRQRRIKGRAHHLQAAPSLHTRHTGPCQRHTTTSKSVTLKWQGRAGVLQLSHILTTSPFAGFLPAHRLCAPSHCPETECTQSADAATGACKLSQNSASTTGKTSQQTHTGVWLEQRDCCAICLHNANVQGALLSAPAAVLREVLPQPPQVCALSRWAAPATQEPV